MKIRVISDLHVDINNHYPFRMRGVEKDVFTLIPGDVSGNPKLTARWISDNIHQGMFIVGNHDPSYNDSGRTIQEQKQFLADKFPLDGNVTFLDEQVGVMSKLIPETNILVIGSTLYTNYELASEYELKRIEARNKELKELGQEPIDLVQSHIHIGWRGLNDFKWGKVPDEIEVGRQRYLRPTDYLEWFKKTIAKMVELIEENSDRDIIVMSHHCPSSLCISDNYVDSLMNSSYASNLEDVITSHPNIKAWCCGHVHNPSFHEIGDNHQLIVCNPRGYERNLESEKWNPNTFIDTDTWKIVTEPYSNTKLENARKKADEMFAKYAGFFF